ncbi:Collagen alpha-4(VI) chain [Bulinus truncatus]|nr:Collagen alpha-4(VI) chain [Bulinus truncatus]
MGLETDAGACSPPRERTVGLENYLTVKPGKVEISLENNLTVKPGKVEISLENNLTVKPGKVEISLENNLTVKPGKVEISLENNLTVKPGKVEISLENNLTVKPGKVKISLENNLTLKPGKVEIGLENNLTVKPGKVEIGLQFVVGVIGKMQTTIKRFNLIGILLVILALGRANSEEEEICDVEQGDIIFVMDASSSIGPKYWQVQTSFVANVTKHFTVGPSRVRFGALIFYKTPHKIFDLKVHLTNEAVSKALLEIPYPKSSGTYTHLALQEVVNQNMFGAAAGGREKAPDIVIVITDGLSIYPKKTSEVANLLKSKNIILLSIGIGSEPKQSELEAIASDKSLVFSVRDFDVLQGIQNDLVRIACKMKTV